MELVSYPAVLPCPMPGGFAPRQRRASSAIDGPLQQRARQRDASGLASQYTYVYTPEQMSVWLQWYRDTLLDGRRWFACNLPGPGGLVPRVVRYRAIQQQLLGGGIYRVSASFEQRGAALPVGVELDPTDPYFDDVLLLLHGDGANGSTSIIDSSPREIACTAGGGAHISTAQAQFGGSSVALNGGSAYVETALYSPTPETETFGPFCFEGWFRFSRTGVFETFMGLLDIASPPIGWFVCRLAGGTLNLFVGNQSLGVYRIVGTTVVTQDVWHHVALTRGAGAMRLWVDGRLEGSFSVDGLGSQAWFYNIELRSVLIGAWRDNSGAKAEWMAGHFDDVRLTFWHERYEPPGPFVPPSEPFPNA